MTTSRSSLENALENVDAAIWEVVLRSNPGSWDPALYKGIDWFLHLPKAVRKLFIVAAAWLIVSGNSKDLPELAKTIDVALEKYRVQRVQ